MKTRLIALTREVPESIVQCELTHLVRYPIDLQRARQQHDAYEHALAELGCEVRRLLPAPSLPDSVFVEDTVIVFDEIAVLARPGASSRQPEVDSMESVIRLLRPVARIEPPGTLDGGDVLVLDREVFAGLSRRTNAAGVEQLAGIVESSGYTVRAVPVTKCLHFKSAVTRVGENLLLINPAWVDPTIFSSWRLMECDPTEPFGANALWVNGAVVYPTEHARTRSKLEGAGCRVVAVPAGELSKAEGGVTCCAVLVRVDG